MSKQKAIEISDDLWEEIRQAAAKYDPPTTRPKFIQSAIRARIRQLQEVERVPEHSVPA